jgi:transposase
MTPMDSLSEGFVASVSSKEPWPFPFAREDWEKTPPAVRLYVAALHNKLTEQAKLVESVTKRVDELETRVNRNSSNSNQPPSSDPPFKKKGAKPHKGKPGGKRGHKGHRYALLEPGEIKPLGPKSCPCGNTDFPETEPFYTHQYIELPEIKMEVTHFVLYRGKCPCCGKMNKGRIPEGYQIGYGPRLSAAIAQMAGGHGDSRTLVQEFCASVLNIPISLGAIQKILDRVSAAIKPHYDRIGEVARTTEVNHVDETSHTKKGVLQWLWVMTNATVAFFMIHANRSKKAFEALIGDWEGILVSDSYGVYCKWVGLRQACLAHLIRKAQELSEKKAPEIARFGKWAHSELVRLCHMAHAPPTVGEWRAFYARLMRLITLNVDRKDEAGRFARRLLREIDSLWLFLAIEGVAPTNNHAERILRFAVLWRKRSQGTRSEKGDRWVERILSLRQTCRLKSKRLYPVVVDALRAHFHQQQPDLAWIR